jgi:hypothetical protein
LSIVPLTAALEGRVIGSVGCAGAVGVDIEASVAMFTNSNISVEGLTIAVDFAADSVVVEDVTEGALDAESLLPGLATKVVVNFFQEISVLVFWTKGSLGLRGEDLAKVDNLT